MTIVFCSNFQSGSTMEMGLTHLKNLSRSQLIGYGNKLHSNCGLDRSASYTLVKHQIDGNSQKMLLVASRFNETL